MNELKSGSKSLQQDFEPCQFCKSDKFSSVSERRDGTRVVKCLICHVEFVNPIPSDDYLKKSYDQIFLDNGKNTSLLKNYIRERKDRRKSYEKLYSTRLKLIEKIHKKKGKLLDIGCAAGFFLKTAESRGWDTYGIDLLPDYIDFAKQELHLKNVYCDILENIKFPQDSFDVVTLWDLIEHLRRPLDTLREVNRILRPGGKLVIWTPNVKNAVFQKAAWYGYTIPLHFYFFSSSSLSGLLNQSGFSVVLKKTNKTKKGMFFMTKPNSYQRPPQPLSRIQKIKNGLKRDVMNSLNPINYLSPLLDKMGYGFNLFMIAQKDEFLN